MGKGEFELISVLSILGKEGVIVLQLLTYKWSLELFSLSSIKIHIRMANFTWVSLFPGAASNLNSSSVDILR